MNKRPDYILDVPEEMIVRAFREDRKGIILPVPADYAGETDIFLHTPLTGRIYRPVGHDVRHVFNGRMLFSRMADAGLALSRDLQDLQSLYARSRMAIPPRMPAELLIVTWDELEPATLSQADNSAAQRLYATREDFFALHFIPGHEITAAENDVRFPVPARQAHIMRGLFNFEAGPVQIIEHGKDNRPTGWSQKATIIPGGVWRGPLKDLPAAFSRAYDGGSPSSTIFRLKDSFAKAGNPLACDSHVTAVIMEPLLAENVSSDVANSSIIPLNAIRKDQPVRKAGPGKPGLI